MGDQRPTIRPGAGSYSCNVHVHEAAMLRHLVSQFGASQVARTTFAFGHSPVAQVVPAR